MGERGESDDGWATGYLFGPVKFPFILTDVLVVRLGRYVVVSPPWNWVNVSGSSVRCKTIGRFRKERGGFSLFMCDHVRPFRPSSTPPELKLEN